MASKSISDLTRNELVALAQAREVPGYKGMKKEDLLRALLDLGEAPSMGADPEFAEKVDQKGAQASTSVSRRKKGDAASGAIKLPKSSVHSIAFEAKLPASKSPASRNASDKNAVKTKARRTVADLPQASKTTVIQEIDEKFDEKINTVAPAVAKSKMERLKGEQASKKVKSPARPERSSTLTAKSRGQRPSTLTPTAEALNKRDLAHATSEEKLSQDRFVLLVRDPYWLQVVWEFSRGTIQRAEAALSTDWHRAVPTLRVLDVSGHDATSRSETRLQDITIHGGVNYWYIPIDGQQRSYRIQIGYLTSAGRFQVLARSNVVTPPRPGTPGTISGGWDDLNGEYQRVFALSGGYSESSMHSPVRDLLEERLGRPIDSWDGHLSLNDGESNSPKAGGHLPLTLHAELVIHGITLPDARVSVVEEPAKLKPDGSFQVRLGLEDGRHLIRTVASRADGSAERTVILSIERNTKELEPHAFEVG